jgi:hypothetical protein
MIRVHGIAGLTGCWDARVLMQSVEQERKRHLLNLSMQYGTKGESPSFCSMNFCVIFVNGSFMLLPYLQQFSLLPVREITYNRSGGADTWIMLGDSDTAGFHVSWVVLTDMWYGYKAKTYRMRHHRTDIRIWLWCTFIRRCRHFSSDWHWQWERWHFWHKLHIMVWQYTLLIYHMCSPQVCRGFQWVRTNSGNLYYHQHLDTLHEGQSLLPDVDCLRKVFVFGKYYGDGT